MISRLTVCISLIYSSMCLFLVLLEYLNNFFPFILFDSAFDEPEDDVYDVEELPDWLLEVAEDLDVLIVERHFEDAYSLIEKTRNYLKESPPSNEIVVQDILCVIR